MSDEYTMQENNQQTVDYSDDNIKTLTGTEHIRLRPGMYIGRLGDGSFPEDGIYVLLKEVIDNSIDEFKMKAGDRIEINIMDNLRVSVRDYGRGIPNDELPHVKEKFYKGSSKDRGTGIGLSVCDEIVTRHGGHLDISNAEDRGCIVSIYLPVTNSASK